MKMLRDILTGKDNETHDIGRWGLAAGILSLLGFTGWAITHGQQFDPTTYAGAVTILLGGGAGALKLKASTEPGG